jgi:hypothetical protein
MFLQDSSRFEQYYSSVRLLILSRLVSFAFAYTLYPLSLPFIVLDVSGVCCDDDFFVQPFWFIFSNLFLTRSISVWGRFWLTSRIFPHVHSFQHSLLRLEVSRHSSFIIRSRLDLSSLYNFRLVLVDRDGSSPRVFLKLLSNIAVSASSRESH